MASDVSSPSSNLADVVALDLSSNPIEADPSIATMAEVARLFLKCERMELERNQFREALCTLRRDFSALTARVEVLEAENAGLRGREKAEEIQLAKVANCVDEAVQCIPEKTYHETGTQALLDPQFSGFVTPPSTPANGVMSVSMNPDRNRTPPPPLFLPGIPDPKPPPFPTSVLGKRKKIGTIGHIAEDLQGQVPESPSKNRAKRVRFSTARDLPISDERTPADQLCMTSDTEGMVLPEPRTSLRELQPPLARLPTGMLDTDVGLTNLPQTSPIEDDANNDVTDHQKDDIPSSTKLATAPLPSLSASPMPLTEAIIAATNITSPHIPKVMAKTTVISPLPSANASGPAFAAPAVSSGRRKTRWDPRTGKRIPVELTPPADPSPPPSAPGPLPLPVPSPLTPPTTIATRKTRKPLPGRGRTVLAASASPSILSSAPTPRKAANLDTPAASPNSTSRAAVEVGVAVAVATGISSPQAMVSAPAPIISISSPTLPSADIPLLGSPSTAPAITSISSPPPRIEASETALAASGSPISTV